MAVCTIKGMLQHPDGTILAPFDVEDDVLGQSFCGTFRLELHDLRDNALLTDARRCHKLAPFVRHEKRF